MRYQLPLKIRIWRKSHCWPTRSDKSDVNSYAWYSMARHILSEQMSCSRVSRKVGEEVSKVITRLVVSNWKTDSRGANSLLTKLCWKGGGRGAGMRSNSSLVQMDEVNFQLFSWSCVVKTLICLGYIWCTCFKTIWKTFYITQPDQHWNLNWFYLPFVLLRLGLLGRLTNTCKLFKKEER